MPFVSSREHGFRFFKQDLLWTRVHVRTPEQFELWSWLVAIVMIQLYLARDLGQAVYRPMTSARTVPSPLPRFTTVCRPYSPSLAHLPVRADHVGFLRDERLASDRNPAPRFPIVRKHPKKEKKAESPLPSSA